MIHFVAVVSHKNLSRASILRDSVTVSLMNAAVEKPLNRDCTQKEVQENEGQEDWQKNGWQKDKNAK